MFCNNLWKHICSQIFNDFSWLHAYRRHDNINRKIQNTRSIWWVNWRFSDCLCVIIPFGAENKLGAETTGENGKAIFTGGSSHNNGYVRFTVSYQGYGEKTYPAYGGALHLDRDGSITTSLAYISTSILYAWKAISQESNNHVKILYLCEYRFPRESSYLIYFNTAKTLFNQSDNITSINNEANNLAIIQISLIGTVSSALWSAKLWRVSKKLPSETKRLFLVHLSTRYKKLLQ